MFRFPAAGLRPRVEERDSTVLTSNIARADNWTETRMSELKTMWLEGKSASQIARQLGGVSRNAVIGKVHRMGLAGRDRPTEPRALGRTSRRRFTTSQSHSMSVRRPPPSLAAPIPCTPAGPELTATASILTLAQEDCRWPIGDPKEADFGYCGRGRGRHNSYCDHHAGLAMHKRAPRDLMAGLVSLFEPVAGR
jgi:GcrA cell cycle regulator